LWYKNRSSLKLRTKVPVPVCSL